MTALAQRSPSASQTGAEVRDVHAWEAGLRRLLRPDRIEHVDGSAAQRHRLVSRGVRLGTLDAERTAAGDASSVPLVDLLPDAHRRLWEADAPLVATPLVATTARGAGDDEPLHAEALRRFSGAARGRTLWLAPFTARAGSGQDPALGVLATDSFLAVLSLLETAEVGATALARVEVGEPWTAVVHSVGLPLDDEHGYALRDDAAWPQGPRWGARLRGGAEVWSCGSPVAPA